MMDRIGPIKFREWQEYEKLEPFGEAREDRRMSFLVAQMYNMMRKKGTEPFRHDSPLNEFLIELGERKRFRQTDDQKFDIISSFLLGSVAAQQHEVIQRPKVQEPVAPVVT